MSTAKRRRGRSLHLELPSGISEERPPIAALFLVKFDAKAGYTIAWKRSIPGLQLSESVEYKSLPSGLHNVQEDIVYFMHDDDHAGISAFVNKSDAEQERNALMLAVGALVPLSHGRLGRSWKHIDKLKDLARDLLRDPTQTQDLEEFWEANYLGNKGDTEQSGSPSNTTAQNGNNYRRQSQPPPNGRAQNRGRAISSASGLAPLDQRLSSHHPALSLPSLLDTFGPLIYPLYKAALLRKRILMLTEAPVELSCNFVYDISILSSIPPSISDLIPLQPLPTRLQPLYAIGVHDIESLSRVKRQSPPSNNGSTNDDTNYGWIACSTDDVLGTKPTLFDILVTIPPSYTKRAKEKPWPRLKSASKPEIKATQRDLCRYRTLRQELRRLCSEMPTTSPYQTSSSPQRPSETPITDQQTPFFPVLNTQETFDDASSTIDEKIIEPASWTSLAYSSFMWWASAGEKRADLDEEAEHDASLFRDLIDYSVSPNNRPSSRRASSPNLTSVTGAMTDGSTAAFPEMSIIAYFHRLTGLILGTLAGIVDAWDPPVGQEEEGQEVVVEAGAEERVLIRSDDMTCMGLDSWSEGDREFVRELVELYWGRRAEVQGTRIECCGVTIAG